MSGGRAIGPLHERAGVSCGAKYLGTGSRDTRRAMRLISCAIAVRGGRLDTAIGGSANKQPADQRDVSLTAAYRGKKSGEGAKGAFIE